MSGNAEANRRTRDKLLLADPNHYKRAGSKGGKAHHKYRRFRDEPGAAKQAGKLGGLIKKGRK